MRRRLSIAGSGGIVLDALELDGLVVVLPGEEMKTKRVHYSHFQN